MKKYCGIFFLIIVLLITIFGVNPKLLINTQNEAKMRKVSSSIKIVDMAGREVVIDQPVQRIISGYYPSTSMVISLGLKDNLVGIEERAVKRPLYNLCAKNLLSLPGMGSAKSFDIERCLTLKPDMVVLPLRLLSCAPTLEKFGITVIFINPESLKKCLDALDILSRATKKEQRAKKIKDFTEKQIRKLSSLPKNGKSVYLAGVTSLLNTSGSKMYQSNMITLAGGRNVAEKISDLHWAQISYEQLLAWNPEVIIIASDAKYSVDDVLKNHNLTNCSAVKLRQVYKMPNTVEAWDSPVVAGILGSLWLASRMYPKKITENYCDKAIKEFYKEFYEFDYQK